MQPPPSTPIAGRTVVLGTWLLVVAVAGRPAWVAVLLGISLVLVWASPYVLATNRRSSVRSRSLAAPREAGPGR
jgi:hypothetical protein